MPLYFSIRACINIIYMCVCFFFCSLCKVVHLKTVRMFWSRSYGTIPDCIRTPSSLATCSGIHIVRIWYKYTVYTKAVNVHESGSLTNICNIFIVFVLWIWVMRQTMRLKLKCGIIFLKRSDLQFLPHGWENVEKYILVIHWRRNQTYLGARISESWLFLLSCGINIICVL